MNIQCHAEDKPSEFSCICKLTVTLNPISYVLYNIHNIVILHGHVPQASKVITQLGYYK